MEWEEQSQSSEFSVAWSMMAMASSNRVHDRMQQLLATSDEPLSVIEVSARLVAVQRAARRFLTSRRAARRKQAAAHGPPVWLTDLSQGLADPSWIARQEAIESAAAACKAQGERGKNRPHKAVLRALCRAAVDEAADVRASAVEALASICPQGDARAVEYLARLLPPHHGGPGGAHGLHSLGVGEWRGQLSVLEAIKRTMNADVERARELVEEFAGLLCMAEKGREIYAVPEGGMREVIRDKLSRPISLKVMGEGGATVWARLAEMREGEALHGCERALGGASLIVSHERVSTLADEIVASPPSPREKEHQAMMLKRLGGKEVHDTGERVAAALWLSGFRLEREERKHLVELLADAAAGSSESSEHWAVRCAAEGALATIGMASVARTIAPGRGVDPVRELCLGDGDADVRCKGLQVLAREGRGDPAAAQVALDALMDPNSEVREVAGRTVVDLCTRWEECRGGLEAAVRHPDPAIRRNAVFAVEGLCHRGRIDAGLGCELLCSKLGEEVGSLGNGILVRWKGGFTLKEERSLGGVLESVVVYSTGEVLWRKAVVPHGGGRHGGDGVGGAGGEVEVDGGAKLREESAEQRVRRIVRGLPSLLGLLSMEGSGWNGGVSVDYERLRATLLARSAKLKQQKRDNAWEERRKLLTRRDGGGSGGGGEAHVCSGVCRGLGLEEEIDEEGREERAIEAVLAASDEGMLEAASVLARSFRDGFVLPVRSDSTEREAAGQSGADAGDRGESAWADKVMALLGWSQDALDRDLSDAAPAYSTYAWRLRKGAPKLRMPLVIPFEAWYLTEWDADRVHPSLEVAVGCAASLVSIAKNDQIAHCVHKAVGKLAIGSEEVSQRAALVISEVKGGKSIAVGIAAQLSPEYASNADKPSGSPHDDIRDGSISWLDKPSRYLGTPYTHVVTWQNCWLDLRWGMTPPAVSGNKVGGEAAVRVPDGEHSALELVQALDRELRRVPVSTGWSIRSRLLPPKPAGKEEDGEWPWGRVSICTEVDPLSGGIVRDSQVECVVGLRTRSGIHSRTSIAEQLGLPSNDTKLQRSVEGTACVRADPLPKDEWVGESIGSVPLYRIIGPTLETWRPGVRK